MRIRTAIALVTLCATITACGSSSDTQDAAEVKTFCQMATDLETASSGPHGEDPAAITDPAKMKLINYDYAKYGASAERRRLIARWEKDVQNATR